MFSTCANPDCRRPFDFQEGCLYRFHKSHLSGEAPPNTHSVQHLWLCEQCSGNFALEYVEGLGVVMMPRFGASGKPGISRFVAAA